MIHSFETAVAHECGVTAAVVFQMIYYWCLHNKLNGQNFIDGNWWIYNSASAFRETYPYLSEKQIRGALQTLKELGYILCANHNQNPYDRTLWYAVTEKGYAVYGEPEKTLEPEKPLKPEKPIEPEKPKNPAKKTETKGHYGEYGNVRLTDAEHERLIQSFGEDTLRLCIKFLDEYIEEKGYKSKSHNLAIRRWVVNAVKERNKSKKTGYDWDNL